MVNSLKEEWRRVKTDIKQISLEYKENSAKAKDRIEKETYESSKRIDEYLAWNKKVKLTLLEKFIVFIPKIFWVVAVLICIILAIIGTFYWVVITLILSIIIGCILSKII